MAHSSHNPTNMQDWRIPLPPAAKGEQIIAPQPGPQTAFLACDADIVVYGGAAGGGKTWGLLLDALRYAALQPVKGYGAVIFRRTSPQITQQGGLWDQSSKLYPLAGGKSNKTYLAWEWPQHQTRIRFAHMQYDTDRFNWQGAEIAYLAFDELTHFSAEQFFYMLSRNRFTGKVRPRVRATTNPDADSWVKTFLAPWVDERYPYPAAPGEVRYFTREDDAIVWCAPGETPPEHAKTCTFIPAKLSDNPALLGANPEYLANLMALPLVERQRLLYGDWTVRPSGNLFKRHWFGEPVDAAPTDLMATVRRWDLAASEPRRGYSDPDWTVGVKMGRTREGAYYVIDAVFVRDTPAGVKAVVRQTAALDGVGVSIRFPQDPGQAGKGQLRDFVTMLDGYDVGGDLETGDKETRAKPFSAQAEVGNVKIVRGAWNEQYLNQLCAFPNPRVHDDAVDASSGAYSRLVLAAGGAIPIATTRLHLSAEQRAIEDRAEQAQRVKALREARAALVAATEGADVAAGADLDAETMAAVIASAAEEARRVVSVRTDGTGIVYESDDERAARVQNEQQLAENMRYLETQFGIRPGGGFGADKW